MNKTKKIEVLGVKYEFVETPSLPALEAEIFSDNYRVLNAVKEGVITFNFGDVILDLGANEGLFSIMMAKMFPGVHVYAFEPVGRTYAVLEENVRLNQCRNVGIAKTGVGGKMETQTMVVSKDFSGGSSSFLTHNPDNEILVDAEIVTLDYLWECLGLERVKLMKMDVEGAEYEALYNCRVLPKVDFFVGEFHMNTRIEFQARRIDALATWVGNQTKIIFIEPCRMGE